MNVLRRVRRQFTASAISTLYSCGFSKAWGEPFFSLRGCRKPSGQTLPISQWRRILVAKVDWIGDFVLLSPFLRELRRNCPEAKITLIVQNSSKDLALPCPYVDEVLTFQMPEAGRYWAWQAYPAAVQFARRLLWGRHFDAAIAPGTGKSGPGSLSRYLAYLSGAPIRVGYSLNLGETAGAGLLTCGLDGSKAEAELLSNLRLLATQGARIDCENLEVWVSETDRNWASAWMASEGLLGKAFACLAPWARSALKEWPMSKYLDLAVWLQAEVGLPVVMLGTTSDEKLQAEVLNFCAQNSVKSLIGATTLGQAAALLERCSLFVGNDSGLTHIAAASGVPSIVIAGSSCLHRYAPAGKTVVVASDLPCKPCHQADHEIYCLKCIFDEPRCMTEIESGRIQIAVRSLLKDLDAVGGGHS